MNIAVVCVAPSADELIARARTLGAEVTVTALLEDGDPLAQHYGACGADTLYRIPACTDDCVQGSRIAWALRKLAPDAALFPATVRGRFLSAWVAAKLETGLTADCTALALTPEGDLLQTRPAYGGNLLADIVCRPSRPQLASVRPGVFPAPEAALQAACPAVHTLTPPVFPNLLTRFALTPSEGGVTLQGARVIVAGGKGVGGRQGFETLSTLAALLNGAVGATRGAVDAGWVSYAHQVGQTGVTVRPRLYLAFGIHGSVQHIAGMSGAQTVVAVNTDRNAPIFDHADYGIVDDWQTAAEAMIRHLRERKDTP